MGNRWDDVLLAKCLERFAPNVSQHACNSEDDRFAITVVIGWRESKVRGM